MLKQFDVNSLVIALMGASPEINRLCERLFPDIDFEMTRNNQPNFVIPVFPVMFL